MVVPLVIARHYDASGIPRADDWSYLRALFHWTDTGRFDFNNFVSMTLLGQLVIAAPVVLVFGNDIAAVQVLTAMLGLVGLLAVLWLGMTVTGRIWVATFVAVLVAVGPLWGPLSVELHDRRARVHLLRVGVRPRCPGPGARTGVRCRTSSRRWWRAFVGLAIRQYAIVPLVALVLVGGWSLWREGRGRRWWTFVLVVGGFVLASIVLLAYWRTIPNLKALTPELPDTHSLRATFYKTTGMLRLLGLLLAPALVFAGPLRIVKRAWTTASSLSLVLGAGVAMVLVYSAAAAPADLARGELRAPERRRSATASSTGPDRHPPVRRLEPAGGDRDGRGVAAGARGGPVARRARHPAPRP